MVDTANTNSPSWRESRATTAFQRWSSGWSSFWWSFRTPAELIELEFTTGISPADSSASMPLAVIIGKVEFVEVMIEKVYDEAIERTIRILRAK